MSPRTRTRRDGSTRPARHRAVQPAAVVWLTVAWLLLWGSVSVKLVLSGVLVAVLACLAFPLPPVRLHARVRPWPLLRLAVVFLAAVVRASLEVSWVVLRRAALRNAVVALPLRTTSDFALTGIASILSLVPGSVVVEARRSTHTLYLHVLDTPDADAVERYRAQARLVEERFLAAFVPDEEVVTR